MELSWILNAGCRLRVNSNVRFMLVLLMTLTSVALVIQTLYLHGNAAWLPPDSYSITGRRIALYSRLLKEGIYTIQDALPLKSKRKPFTPFECHGRETCFVRFRPFVNASNFNRTYTVLTEDIPFTGSQKYYLYRHPAKLSSSFNKNITKHQPNPGSFSVAVKKNAFIMSAFGRNLIQLVTGKTRFKRPDPATEVRLIVQVGWLNYTLLKNTMNCCLLLGNDSIVSFVNEKRLYWKQVKKQELMATKVFCTVPRALYGVRVKGATISLPSERCLRKRFMAVEYMRQQPENSFAVCAKISYGSMSAQRLIEWLEIQRFIGVDRVLIYFYNLNSEAMRVLMEYQREGFVDLLPFDYPMADEIVRHVGQKDAQPYIDEQVLLYEAMERLRGFTFTAVIDVDEIIYARTSHSHNIKRFMFQLLKKNPKAAGFSFRTELFITDWENKEDLGPEMNMFWHARHQNRTRPLDDRTKNVFIMDRVILGSIWTHNYTALPPYVKYNVPASLGTLKHYRPCRKNWHCYIRRGYRDETVARIMENVKDTISDRFDTLLNKPTLNAIKNKALGRKAKQ